jgi:acyl dehydratase
MDLIGRVSIHSYDVTKKDIRRYAQAIDDPNPLYWNEDYAGCSRWGGIIAPPLFCHSLAFSDVPANQLRPDGLPMELDIPLPVTRTIGGASSFEVLEPVRPGDVITVEKTIKDINKKLGKSGELFFVLLCTTFVNQHARVVARENATFIQR